MKKDNMQDIVCLLDMSGSMCPSAKSAREAFNSFLKEQKEIGEARLTVIWFDHTWKVEYCGLLSQYKKLKHWPANGMTALNDAIGKTFSYIKEQRKAAKTDKVVLAIMTDGVENASREFSSVDIKHLIEKHQAKKSWEVLYLACSHDAEETMKNYNWTLPKENLVTYGADNYDGGTLAMSSLVGAARGGVSLNSVDVESKLRGRSDS